VRDERKPKRADAREGGRVLTTRVKNHWDEHGGFRVGRGFYTWQLVFQGDPVVADVQAAYQPLVRALPGLSPVGTDWLRLDLQGVGFADKLTQEDLDPIVDAAWQRLEGFRSFEIRFGPAVVGTESLQLPVEPADRLRRLRAQLRGAITDVWGRDSVPTLPVLEPHIALGYWNQDADAEPLQRRVDALSGGVAKTEVAQADLINLIRVGDRYEWTTYATVHLGFPDRGLR
jgi:hypothetical protein